MAGKSGQQSRPSNEPTPSKVTGDYRRGMAGMGKDKAVDAGQKTGKRGQQG
jgi:hypothetical protein